MCIGKSLRSFLNKIICIFGFSCTNSKQVIYPKIKSYKTFEIISVVISISLFLIPNLGLIWMSKFISSFLLKFELVYSYSLSLIDYIFISSIPIISIILGYKKDYNFKKCILNNLLLISSVLLILLISVLSIKPFSKFDSPFIPDYYVREPFKLFSTLIISVGLIFPFILKNSSVLE